MPPLFHAVEETRKIPDTLFANLKCAAHSAASKQKRWTSSSKEAVAQFFGSSEESWVSILRTSFTELHSCPIVKYTNLLHLQSLGGFHPLNSPHRGVHGENPRGEGRSSPFIRPRAGTSPPAAHGDVSGRTRGRLLRPHITGAPPPAARGGVSSGRTRAARVMHFSTHTGVLAARTLPPRRSSRDRGAGHKTCKAVYWH